MSKRMPPPGDPEPEAEFSGSRRAMTSEQPWDEPSKVGAEEGAVVVDGPDGVAITLTPDAAIETSERLLEGGLMAQGQRVAKRNEAERAAGGRGAPAAPGSDSA
jgi:hypothetical protein